MTSSGEINIDLGVLAHESEDVYHARAGEFLSSHLLADFRKSPLLYYNRRLGLIDDIDRPAYLLGRAAHVQIPEGRDRYQEQFAVGGPINPKTGQALRREHQRLRRLGRRTGQTGPDRRAGAAH